MKHFRSSFGGLFLLYFGLLSGCVPSSGRTMRFPIYGIGVVNATGVYKPLFKVKVSWEDHGREWIAWGSQLGGSGRVSGQPDPIPESVNVQWTTPDGQRHAKVFTIRSRIPDPKKWKGDIWFRIVDMTDDGMRVWIEGVDPGNIYSPKTLPDYVKGKNESDPFIP